MFGFGRAGDADILRAKLSAEREALAVARSQLQDAVTGKRHLHLTLAAREQELAEARQEIRRLTDVIIELRREGFHPGMVVVQPAERQEEEGLPAAVRQAIDARAEPGTALHRELTADARKMLTVEERSVEQVVTITRYGAKGLRMVQDEAG